MFVEMEDKFGMRYFSYDFDGNRDFTNTSEIVKNFADYDNRLIPSLRFSGPFSTDLTFRDDALLAVLSLFLVCIIDGIVTMFLLQTRNGKVSNTRFSIKVIIESMREFHFRKVIVGPSGYNPKSKKVNLKLVFISISILLGTFGLEVVILVLTEPIQRSVTTNVATLRIVQPVPPNWNHVHFHSRASFNRPCTTIPWGDVDQGRTRINNCITTSLGTSFLPKFQDIDEDVNLEIISDLHEFGAEHSVIIGNSSASYSTRVSVNLQCQTDLRARTRLIPRSSRIPNEESLMDIVHNQCIAFLFSIYKLATKDETITVDQINDINVNTTSTTGPPVIVSASNISVSSPSKRYTTIATGKLPHGDRVLHVLEHVFRGSHGIIVVDSPQLQQDPLPSCTENSTETVHSILNLCVPTTIWKEQIRILNWLSLTIAVVLSLLFLVVCRLIFKPVAAAEVAGVFVKRAVGASLSRSSLQLNAIGERKEFNIAQQVGALYNKGPDLEEYSVSSY